VDRPQECWEDAARHAASYLERHADTFAGDWVSENAGGEYHVALTRDVPVHRRALRELLPRPEVLRVHPARYALAELLAIQRRIAHDADALATKGIRVSSMWPNHNDGLAVSVVASDADTASATLRERYGAAITVDYLGSEQTITESVAWRCYRPDGDGHTLKIEYVTNCCYAFERVELGEDGHEVRVTVLERAPVGFQTQAACKRSATAQLQHPLGDRRVIDGATGRTCPPCHDR
jgi:hypothetical protein